MTMIPRRRVLQLGALGAGLGLGRAGSGYRRLIRALDRRRRESDDRLVRLSGDGLGLTPAQYAAPAVRVCSTRRR